MRRALLALTLLTVVLGGAARPVAAQEPLLSVAVGSYEPGQEVLVSGSGWPGERIISLQTCGNGGLGGSIHCDQTSTRAASSDRTGSFGTRVTVGRPPSPCPCTVRAFLVDGPAVDAPITISGMPEATPIAPDTPFIDGGLVVEASLVDTGSWTSWFGAPPSRTVVLTVENRSTEPITWMPIDLSWGRPANPTGVIEAPIIEGLAPGESTTFEIPVDLPVLAVGSYVIRGEVLGHPGTDITLRTQAAPWGLVAVLGLLLLQVILVRARNALARSLSSRLEPSVGAPAQDPRGLEVVLRDDGEVDVYIDLSDSDEHGSEIREREPA